MAGMAAEFGTGHDRLFLVGGSWRAIARIDMERRGYPLHVLHEYRMSPSDPSRDDQVDRAAGRGRTAQTDRRRRGAHGACALGQPGAGAASAPVAPARNRVSSYGIREGLLYDKMPGMLRDRDPLIEACRFAESKDARLPGFGRVVYDFIEPLFKSAKPDRLRIIKAACLLHDVSWRSHPDYRAEDCFDNATRANLGGLKHSERVLSGPGLLHRYSNNREGTRFRGSDQPDLMTQRCPTGRSSWQGDALCRNAVAARRCQARRNAVVSQEEKLELRLSKARRFSAKWPSARFMSLAASLQPSP